MQRTNTLRTFCEHPMNTPETPHERPQNAPHSHCENHTIATQQNRNENTLEAILSLYLLLFMRFLSKFRDL